MGLINWLLQLVGWRQPPRISSLEKPETPQSLQTSTPSNQTTETVPLPRRVPGLSRQRQWARTSFSRVKLTPTRYRQYKAGLRASKAPLEETKGAAPYRYARYGSRTGHYLDLSRDGDDQHLREVGLPLFRTPEELANWIGLPLNRVAWLVHRFTGGRPETETSAHYHYRWIKKRQGGWRLIESPKSMLKAVQTKILRELLDKIPVHATAHGFVQGHSILTNALPHVGQAVLVKFDLSNFYTTVTFSRVVAIFRSLGYSREVAIWLGLLTTSAIPGNLRFQEQGPYAMVPYLRRHLPQGAPTSPCLANLSAFGLDVRLSGLARSFGATYTRYADDLTVSGPRELTTALATLIPLVQQIVRQERFTANAAKRRVLRAHQRQTVTGVVVNQKLNVTRNEFDQLKAILTNSIRIGPSTQNRQNVGDFYHHLQGRIAHIAMLNSLRGEKLKQLFRLIDWTK